MPCNYGEFINTAHIIFNGWIIGVADGGKSTLLLSRMTLYISWPTHYFNVEEYVSI